MLEMFQLEFMQLAALASCAAAAVLGVFGVYVVLKRIVFVGLALASLATFGAAVALVMGWSVEVAGMLGSLAGALALAFMASPRRIPAEGIVGWTYAAASALAIIVLTRASGEAEAMHLLFGNVLSVSPFQVGLLWGVSLLALALHALFEKRFILVVFDADSARAAGINTNFWTILLYLIVGGVTAATVHATGALLAFALLTMPPMTALLFTRGLKTTFLSSLLLGVGCSLVGLVLSFQLDLPTGPFTVVLLALALPLGKGLSFLRERFEPVRIGTP